MANGELAQSKRQNENFLKDGVLCDPETPKSIMNSKNIEIQKFIKGIPTNE